MAANIPADAREKLSYCTLQEGMSLIFLWFAGDARLVLGSRRCSDSALLSEEEHRIRNFQFRSAQQMLSETADNFSLHLQ